MRALFFYGTLRHAPLLEVVLGRAARARAARLDGYEVLWAAGESFPLIRPAAGGATHGLLVEDIGPQDLARLDFYEGAFSFALVPVTVAIDRGLAEAGVYVPDPQAWTPGEPWRLEDWVRDWGAVSVEAAREVMGRFGHEDARAVAARFGVIRARAHAALRAAAWRRPAGPSGDFTRDDVQVDAISTPYAGFFNIEEYRARHRRFDGTMSEPVSRAIFRAFDAVTVLPYDPLRDRVLMIEQVRLGAYAHGDPQPWLLEPVAGIVDAGESDEQTARRETLEEAGVALSELHFVARYYPSPGGVAQVLISYLGTADLPDDLPALGGLDTEGEDIRSHLVAFGEAMRLLRDGALANAPLIITMQWLAAHREGLRAAAKPG